MNLFSTSIDKLNLKRFFQGEGPQPQPVLLHRRKVYILPTRQGMVFALLLVLMLVGSINYNNSLGFMLTFLLASLSVIAILYTYRNLLDIEVSIGHIEPVYCQQTVSIPFIFQNNNYDRYSIKLSYGKQNEIEFDLSINTDYPVYFPLLMDKRGVHSLDKFTFSTCFPLGLFRAWSYFHVNKTCTVYPRPEGRTQLPDQSFYTSTLLGDQGQGTDDFAGQRKYHPGDSLKQVNWKALAKEQDLLTKQFGGDRCEEIWIDWTTVQQLPVENALSQIALWLIEADRLGFSYGLKLPHTEIKPSCGKPHLSECMVSLAIFHL